MTGRFNHASMKYPPSLDGQVDDEKSAATEQAHANTRFGLARQGNRGIFFIYKPCKLSEHLKDVFS